MIKVLSKYPNIFWASSRSSFFLSKLINALSKRDKASLTEPSDNFIINFNASSVATPFSRFNIFFIKTNNSSGFTLGSSNLWHLERTVIGIFFTSVVANINFKY